MDHPGRGWLTYSTCQTARWVAVAKARATSSPPPCGEGQGGGRAIRQGSATTARPPPLSPPHKGEGKRLLHSRSRQSASALAVPHISTLSNSPTDVRHWPLSSSPGAGVGPSSSLFASPQCEGWRAEERMPWISPGRPGCYRASLRARGPDASSGDASAPLQRATRHHWLSPLTGAGPGRGLTPAGFTRRPPEPWLASSPRARVPHPAPPS